MPSDSPGRSSEEHRLEICAARARLEKHVDQLAHAKNVMIAVQLDPSWAGATIPNIHTVTLRIQNGQTVVCIDHDSLSKTMSSSAFATPQIDAAIDKLMAHWSQEPKPGSKPAGDLSRGYGVHAP